MKRLLGTIFTAAIMIAGAASTSAAAGISVFTVNGNVYQNTLNNPCLFDGQGDPCTQPPLFPDPVGSTQVFATNPLTNTIGDVASEYTSWQTWVGDAFLLGLDVNQSGTTQTMTNLTIAFFGASGQIGTTLSYEPVPLNVPAGNNGTGWADYVFAPSCSAFSGGFCTQFDAFIVPAGTTSIRFTYGMGEFNDGPDRLFAIQADPQEPCPVGVCSPVPEPTTLVLLGMGLVGASVAVRRRRRRA